MTGQFYLVILPLILFLLLGLLSGGLFIQNRQYRHLLKEASERQVSRMRDVSVSAAGAALLSAFCLFIALFFLITG